MEISDIEKNTMLLEIANSDLLSLFMDSADFNYSVIDVNGNYLVQNNNTILNISGGLNNAEKIDKNTWEDCKKLMQSGEKEVREEVYHGHCFLSIKQPLFSEKACVGIRVISFDITDRKRVEQLEREKAAAEFEKEKAILDDRIKTLRQVAGYISHEMRTPIAGLRLCLDLIDGEMQNIKSVAELNESKKFFAEIINRGKQVADSANNLVDMLLMKLRKMDQNVQDTEELMRCSIVDDINIALDKYPLTPDEAKLFHWNKNTPTFFYNGNGVLTAHMLFNLLKNAFKAVKEAGKGKVTLTVQPGVEFNERYC